MVGAYGLGKGCCGQDVVEEHWFLNISAFNLVGGISVNGICCSLLLIIMRYIIRIINIENIDPFFSYLPETSKPRNPKS